MRRLPPDFLMGCATSAYQIEGGIDNDWAAFERAGRLKDPNARCHHATDHWNRWSEDFDLLGELGAHAYRMSVEWARVEPEPGRFDEAAIAQYVEMIEGLRARGIEPFVTLLHFTHPKWFHETCPWHVDDGAGPARFEFFARRMAEAFGDRVRFYTVINEPSVWLSGAYVGGVIPPAIKSLRALGAAMASLLRAHACARRAIRETVGDDVQIGVAHNVVRFEAARRWHPGDRVANAYVKRFFNRAFVQAIRTGRLDLGFLPGILPSYDVSEAKDTLDFLGINYYSRVYIETNILGRGVMPYYEDRFDQGVTDLGWEVHPAGLTHLLQEIAPPGLPVYITENGLDDRDDTRRAAFLVDHLDAVLDARDAGIDVRGYFHWSLLDNFEWLEGFEPRFGLYRVDYETQRRTPTHAVEVFKQIAQTRTLPSERPAFTRKSGGRTPVG